MRSKTLLTQDELKQLLTYDPSSGVFRWVAPTSFRARAGEIAGCLNAYGHRVIGIYGKLYYAHRLAWLYVHGRHPSALIDHINGLRDDNRLENLREATRAENQQNLRRSCRNTSGHTGVSWNSQRKKWCAHIQVNGKSMGLGRYKEFEDAVAAYKAAKARYHPFQPEPRVA